MKITVRELTTAGPTIHSAFKDLPFHRVTDQDARIEKPILAYQSPSCIKIVGDIYRFEAAQDARRPSMPVYLIQESESTLELLDLVMDYFAPMTLMDKALLVKAAIELGVPRSLLASKILPKLDLPPNEKAIDQILFLLKLPIGLQHFVVDKGLSLKRVLIFERASHHLDWVERFIANLRVGINMAAEIIQNVWEMAQLQDVDFQTMAERMGLWEMADQEYEDSRVAVMEIREKINRARYPTLTEAGQTLADHINSLELPSGVSVKWDPYFERQGVDIAFHANDGDNLKDVIDALSKPEFSDIFKHI